jgi:hypothetical protein
MISAKRVLGVPLTKKDSGKPFPCFYHSVIISRFYLKNLGCSCSDERLLKSCFQFLE